MVLPAVKKTRNKKSRTEQAVSIKATLSGHTDIPFISSALETVCINANKNTQAILIKKIRLRGNNLEFLKNCKSAFDKSILLFLNYKDESEKLSQVWQLRNIPTSKWLIRDDYVTAGSKSLNDNEIQSIKDALVEKYKDVSGDNFCETQVIQDEKFQYIIIKKAGSTEYRETVENGQEKPLFFVPITHFAIVYEPKYGRVEVHAEEAETRNALHAIFANKIFDITIGSKPKNKICDLSAIYESLITGKLDYQHSDDAPDVNDIFVSRITLVKRNSNICHSISTDSDERKWSLGRKDAIFAGLFNLVKTDGRASDKLKPEQLTPVQIEMKAIHTYGDGKEKIKNFKLGGRNETTLGYYGIDRQIRNALIHNQYLNMKQGQASAVA